MIYLIGLERVNWLVNQILSNIRALSNRLSRLDNVNSMWRRIPRPTSLPI